MIVVHVVVPTNLTEEQRELAEKLDETLEPRNLDSRAAATTASSRRVRRAFG